ncbi:hypothetical protein [Chromobacterium phragmitis]|uniref:Uncharacterized protein n=2 Tax=Chromobacterium phragmitis TaxID=2202141 RepID=A0ABV0IRV4_9NEIS|nr:hypothetical protein [Chromobacterium phragmitis]
MKIEMKQDFMFKALRQQDEHSHLLDGPELKDRYEQKVETADRAWEKRAPGRSARVGEWGL